ncbi:xylulokinase [Deinococcus aquiradiocola]|nr:FGGY family carbohydrate kinase [Deinococcus aquiradiocola]
MTPTPSGPHPDRPSPAAGGVLALDLGTGSVKVGLIGPGGEVLASASRPYPVRADRPGWAESLPGEWWAATVDATREVRAARPDVAVRAVGLSGQMHGVVLSGANGEALRGAVLWSDGRSTAELARYRALPEARQEALRNPAVTGMAGPTLLWLARHEPEVLARARWALQPKDWLRLHLTGEAFSDPSDASGTLLYDLTRDAWDHALLTDWGLDARLLPPLRASGAQAGHLQARAATALGVPAGLPVATGAGDTAASLLAGGLPDGEAQLTVGTGAQIVQPSGTLPGPVTGGHVFRDAGRGWYALAAVQNAGTALEWARRALNLSWPDFYAAAQAAGPLQGPVFLPFVTGDRTPHLDAHARAGWIGAGLEHDARHLARAAFEGVALSISAAAAVLPLRPGPLWLAGGGTSDPWWRQLLADALRRDLRPVAVPGASLVGAGLLAWQALGHHPDRPPLTGSAPVTAREDGIPAGTRARFTAAYPALKDWFRSPA